MGGQHIKVYVRARPLNQNERSSGSCSVVSTTDQTVTLRERGQDKLAKTFTFDRVFGCKSRQVDVYRNVVMPLLDEVLLGYNCTVFAYGQTGTGKTFTMEGESSDASLHWDQDPSMGIIPRTLSQLFDELRLLGCESTVRVSFLEMYNEELFDLLSPATDTTRLRLYEDSTRKGSCIINHLEEVIVHNKNEVFGILQRGSAKRQTAATLMNAHSSRSHTVFSVTVHIKENNVEGEELLKIGKLNLVDLAGSENIGRSGAVERRAREAGNINQSLLTLGRVITSLVEGTPHIPYRESKLTRLLQDSLGGKTKTSIIATISPAYCNVEETLSTLDYAHRAKKITNRPEINQKLTKTTVIKEYTAEIERLRRDLNATREQSGVYLASENYQQMMSQIEDQSREIVDKLGHIRALQQQLESFQSSFSELKDNLEERESQLKSTNDELEATKQSLEERSVQCDEQRHLVSVHAATERQLTDQASQLLSVAAVATKDLGAVHSALDRKRHVETETQTALALFRQQSEGALTTLQQLITQQSTSAETFFTSLSTRLQELNERQACHTQGLSSQVLQLSDGCGQQLQQLLLELQSQSSCQLKIVADMSEEMNQQRQKHTEWQRSVTDRLADMSTSSTQLLQQLHSHGELHQQETTQLLSALSAALRDDLSGVRTGAELLSSKHEQWREKRAESESERRRQKEENRAVLADAEQSVEKRLQQVQSRVQQLNSELQLLSSEVASSRSAGDRLLAVVEEHNDQQCQESGLVAGFVDGCVETVQEALKQADASLTEHQRRAEQNCQNFVTRNSDLVQEVSECLKSADADVQTSLESQQASNSDHVRSMETQLERLGQSITADSTSTQNALNTTVDTLHRSCESARETLGEYGRRAGEAVGEMEKAGCDQADSGQDLQRKQETAVRDVRQLVNRLVEEQVLADVPSGATPQRRNLSFPRYLAATSPHERILQRHRNNLTTATKLSQQQQTDVDECSPTEFALPVAVPSEGAASEVLVQEPQEPQPASLSRSSSTVSVSSDMENQHPAAGSQAGKAVIPRPKRHTRATAASANPEVAQKRILQQHN